MGVRPMKRDRESIYVHLNREIGRILEGRISAVVNTDLDGVLWKLADELADKPTADVTGDVCIHGVLKFIPYSRCFNNEPAS